MGEFGKSLLIGTAVFIMLILIFFLFLWFNSSNPDNLNPSVKTIITKVPILNKRVEEAKVKADIEKQLSFIEEEKNKIQSEWQNIEKAKAELKAQETKLQNIEQELELQKNELNSSMQKVQDNLQNVKDIAGYYELMEPDNAAKILSEMDNDLVIQIFKNMKRDSVSLILASMDPKKAGQITLIMSGINNTQ